ncbi:hypothetical protein Cs7R123_21320 [Catellatospora sp. TT07R-123]|uniref:hypothetical protein n=1 Tax=Catellatospora sp. TT07R-123 TaxID=2733863 RepID=UPI001B2D408A|nr:hypothetical protein [Catellatospora sp. TT07R-123]GHJ44790.1 hypothetical protein Cs7R123_21320 [Catellatospora sp. TT07R-123]
MSSYLARYRLGPITQAVMALGVLAAAAGALLDLPEDPTIVLVAGGLTLPLTLLALYGPLILSGRPALRVDETGILFGGRPPIQGRTTAFVPWSEIAEIYLFRVDHLVVRTTYIGLKGHDGRPAPLRPVLPESVARTFWHVPRDVVLASRPTYGYRLDKAAFVAAVAAHAEDTMVIDLTAVAAAQAPAGLPGLD